MRVLIGFLLACVLVLVPVSAEAAPGCIINVAGIRICGEVIGVPLPPVVTVTVRPNPITITVPGPTRTVTVRPEPIIQNHEVIVPGPTATVTKTVQPQAAPTPDSVPAETSTVTATVTATPSETATRQTRGTGGTIEAGRPTPSIDFGDGQTTVVEAGIGLLTLLALVGLLLIALYAGYVLGYKDRERKDTDFMRALLDSVKSRGKHS